MRILPPPPYDFGLLLTFLSRWRHPALDFHAGGAYRRVIRAEDGLALIEACSHGTPHQPEIDVRLLASQGDVSPESVHERVAWVLGADALLPPFWAWTREQPDLAAVLAPVEGLPALRSDSVFEALMLTIVEQQIAWTAAQRAQRLLCEWGSDSVEYDGSRYYTLPSPERLAAAEVHELKMLKVTDRRVGVMIRIADEVVSGRLDLESLHGCTDAERYARLTAIKGIGHWTACMALTRAFGPYPAYASNDVALRAAVKHYLPQHAAAPDPIAAAFEPHGRWGGVAAMMVLSRWVIDRYQPVLNLVP